MKYLKLFILYALNSYIHWLLHVVLNSKMENIGCFNFLFLTVRHQIVLYCFYSS